MRAKARGLSVAAQSGSILVTSNADSGAGSLRAAVASLPAGGEVTFGLSTPATITLLTPLVVDHDMTITGPG